MFLALLAPHCYGSLSLDCLVWLTALYSSNYALADVCTFCKASWETNVLFACRGRLNFRPGSTEELHRITAGIDTYLVPGGCGGLMHYTPFHANHDDVIRWKHFPRYWPFVRGIHRSPVNSPHKGQWRGALMFSVICVWINAWVNNHEAGGLRCHRGHCDVTVM